MKSFRSACGWIRPPVRASDIPAVHARLARHFRSRPSPVAVLRAAQTRDPFRILVATLLSARTRDETTTAVIQRLFRVVRNLDDLRRIPLPELERLLYPVGFFRTKARRLKQLPAALDRLGTGGIPRTLSDLMRLPGVGRKTANLVLAEAFGQPAIAVDVHVHRICNRLGLLTSRTPAETEASLHRLLPRRYWRTWNRYLVALGQTVCRPQRPRCAACPLAAWCARRGVVRSRRALRFDSRPRTP